MMKLVLMTAFLFGLTLPMIGLASPAVLSEQLHEDKNWTLVETRADGISVAEKAIEGIAVNAVKVSQTLEIDPETLAQVIEDIANYGRFLNSAPGLQATLLEDNGDHIIGYQYVEVPLLSDRVYGFKMFRPDTSATRVDWELIPPDMLDGYTINKIRGVYIDVGVGSWSMHQRPDGQYDVACRLVMDPGGWLPDAISDYFNRVSIVGIFKDAIIETERRGVRGKS